MDQDCWNLKLIIINTVHICLLFRFQLLINNIWKPSAISALWYLEFSIRITLSKSGLNQFSSWHHKHSYHPWHLPNERAVMRIFGPYLFCIKIVFYLYIKLNRSNRYEHVCISNRIYCCVCSICLWRTKETNAFGRSELFIAICVFGRVFSVPKVRARSPLNVTMSNNDCRISIPLVWSFGCLWVMRWVLF